MGRRAFVLYIVLFVISVSTITIHQSNDNVNTEYALNIEYEAHTCDMGSTAFRHTYSTIVINVQVRTTNYEETFSGLSVGGFPFWVDVSAWEVGNTVQIAGNSYELSISPNTWKAHLDFGDMQYENLYYHRDFGIFIASYTDRATLDLYGFSGYTKEIQVEQSNLEGFISRVTGSNIMWNFGLVTGIFIELAVIQWFIQRRNARLGKLFDE